MINQSEVNRELFLITSFYTFTPLIEVEISVLLKELKAMLVGLKGISSLNKKQLVNLFVEV